MKAQGQTSVSGEPELGSRFSLLSDLDVGEEDRAQPQVAQVMVTTI